jgi:AraC-like DNA-binding protein
MHADAAHPWTVPEVAALSGLSRATFARAFQEAIGQASMQYLTESRMTLARDHLRSGDLSLAQIACRTGYTSAYAFAAAFRRHHGQSPGRWRHDHSLHLKSLPSSVLRHRSWPDWEDSLDALLNPSDDRERRPQNQLLRGLERLTGLSIEDFLWTS